MLRECWFSHTNLASVITRGVSRGTSSHFIFCPVIPLLECHTTRARGLPNFVEQHRCYSYQGGEMVRTAEEVRRYEYEPPPEPIQFMTNDFVNCRETVQARRYAYESLCPPPRPDYAEMLRLYQHTRTNIRNPGLKTGRRRESRLWNIKYEHLK